MGGAMTGLVNIALVGRTPILREGLSHILPQGGFEIVCSVESTDALIALNSQGQAELDLILIENADPRAIAADAKALHLPFPDVRVAILADVFDLGALLGAIRAGVDGFIVADMNCQSLIESLKLVAMGERLLPSQLADNMPMHLSKLDQGPPGEALARSSFSPVEVEVMQCLVFGYPNKSIARRLEISEAAVKVHVKAVLRKIRVTNRTQAAIWAAHHGLCADSGAELQPPHGDRSQPAAAAPVRAPSMGLLL